MKVIVLGAGQVGYNIARYLAAEDYHVTIVDQSPELIKKISDTLDVQPILGQASHPSVLQQAGADEADILIAVTASDEVNIVACEVAHSLFKVETKIARIRNQQYLSPLWSELFAPPNLSIDVIISPENEVAKAISRSLQVGGAFDVIPLSGGFVNVVGLRCVDHASVSNTPIRLIPNLVTQFQFVIVCIVRGDSKFIPTGEDQIIAGDEVYVILEQQYIKDLIALFGHREGDTQHAIIVGGGNIGLTLAKEIERHHPDISIKLLERNNKRAEMVARQLRKSEVLCGDALDQDLLIEAGIDSVHAVVTVTDDDKVNILTALLAKRLGAKKSQALLNNMSYGPLVTSLGVDAIINPRAITVSKILQHIRQGKIRSIHTIADDFSEVLEVEVRESSNVTGLSIEEIQIKGSILVAALLRDDNIVIQPSKQWVIQAKDRLILVVTKDVAKKVEKLFAIRPSYL